MKMLIGLVFISVLVLQPLFAKYDDTKTWKLDANGIKELRVDVPVGSVEIVGSETTKEIVVTADIVIRKMDDDEAVEYLKKCKMDLVKKGDKAVFEFDLKKGKHHWFFGSSISISIDITIEVPRSMNLDLSSGAGDFDVKKITGNLTVETGAGNITLTDVKGIIEADSGAGNVEIKKVIGDVTVETGAGNIELDDIKGDVDADSGAGNISINDIDGLIVADTGIGNIDVSGKHKKVRANTGLGKCYIDDDEV